MKFNTWLKLQINRDDRIGDISKDLLQDYYNDVPQSIKKIRNHLDDLNVNDEVKSALEEAWQEYKICKK